MPWFWHGTARVQGSSRPRCFVRLYSAPLGYHSLSKNFRVGQTPPMREISRLRRCRARWSRPCSPVWTAQAIYGVLRRFAPWWASSSPKAWLHDLPELMRKKQGGTWPGFRKCFSLYPLLQNRMPSSFVMVSSRRRPTTTPSSVTEFGFIPKLQRSSLSLDLKRLLPTHQLWDRTWIVRGAALTPSGATSMLGVRLRTQRRIARPSGSLKQRSP